MEKTEAWIAGFLVVSIVLSVAGIVVLNSKSVPVYSSTSKMTAFATGYVNGTIESMVAYELSPTVVDFGNLTLGESNDTENNTPPPFGLNNTGTVKVNMTIAGTTLFTGTNPVYNYSTVCDEAGADCGTTRLTGGITDTGIYVDMVGATANALSNWEFDDSFDNILVNIKITVPLDEPAGTKISTVTFTGIQA